MPTEIEYKTLSGETLRTQHVQPDKQAIIHDGRGDDEKLIGVWCHPEDERTDIFVADKRSVPKIKGRFRKKIRNPLFSDGYREASIFSGQQPEFRIRQIGGQAVRVIIKHSREFYPPGQSPEEF
ncbi:MAG TPA: hypothetical protein VFW52_02555 [Candidatus Saccharimonadales bacterium]|nr:hypothetical protein [Candidatus Saccharimonadales bacterium]